MKPQLPSTWQRNMYLCGLFTESGSKDNTHTKTLLKRADFYRQFVVPFEIQDLLPS